MATIATLDVLLNLKDEFSKGLDKSSSSLDAWSKKLTKVGKTLTMGVTTPLVGAAGMAIKWASDLEETINKTNVLFDGASRSVIEWSEDSATAMGMSQQAALDYAGSFAGMLNTVAEGPAELANMSRTLAELTSDFASFHNLNPEEAFTVISSALAGETEAIRRYGVDMSAANVELVAMEMGLANSTAELTAQDKALARYQILLNETTEEQGDFARTQDSTANRMKIARARVRDLGTSFGRLLLPYVQKALNYFTELLDRFEKLSPRTQKIILLVGALLAVLGPVLIVIGMMLPALGALGGLLLFLVSPIGLIILAIAALVAGFIYAYTHFEGFREAVNSVMDALSIFKPVLDDIIDAFQALKEGNFAEVWDELKEAAMSFISALGQIDWGNVLRMVGQLIIDGLIAGAKLAWEIAKVWFFSIPSFILEAIASAGVAFIDLLKAHGMDLLKGLQQGVTDWWDTTVSPWFAGLPERIRVAIGVVTEAIKQKGIDIIQGLWDGITNRWASVKYWFGALGATIFGIIGSLIGTLKDKGMDLIEGLWVGISDNWDSVRIWLKALGTLAVQTVGNLLGKLYQAGRDLIQGLINGIEDKIPGLRTAIDTINWLVDQIDRGDSPWPMFIKSGQDLIRGLEIGIDRRIPHLERTIAGVNATVDGAATVNGASGPSGGNTYVSISLRSEELVDLIRKAENGNTFASSFGSELGLRAGAF